MSEFYTKYDKTPCIFIVGVLFYLRLVMGNDLIHTDIILIGGMGDLSQKYLLNGFFALVNKHSSETRSFAFYPSGRSNSETTEPALIEILTSKLNCDSVSEGQCLTLKKNFLKLTRYVQLKTSDDYSVFCKELKIKWENFIESNGQVEVIFYLSIPSSGYVSTARFIGANCRLKSENWSLKVVLEKPFGHDKKSANQMSLELSNLFSEEEIYRVDHYLGKTITREILNFRKQNPNLEKLLNRHEVDQVEIFMKEVLDVKGRIEFYDQTGVIKDVLQNHLTELLLLVAMELPQNLSSKAIKSNKLRLLKQVEPVKMSAVVLGQYANYMKEAEKENANLNVSKYTPTFAGTILNIHSPKWEGIPFILVSGKKLAERSSYIRIVLRRNRVCINLCDDKSLQQVVFHIGHGQLNSPAILVSRSLEEPKWPEGFTVQSHSSISRTFYNQNEKDLFIAFPNKDPDAYMVLIERMFLKDRDKFIGTDHLMALWNIWSQVAQSIPFNIPRLYESGDVNDDLAMKIDHARLEFVKENDFVPYTTEPLKENHTPSSFLGHKLICTSKRQLAFHLAKHISISISAKLKVANEFHIAFSGGNSPAILFETLAQHFPDIPWEFVHIWQVDERCVPPTDKNSNFRQLETKLLRFINIPHFSIHPMPVDVAGKLCSPRDDGLMMYEKLMIEKIGTGLFDYVVLGVGIDGHTASIFPHSKAVQETVRLTAYTDKQHDHLKHKRMTLTLTAINNAKQISFFVTGKEKQEVLKQLEEKAGDVMNYPVLGVDPRHGLVTWYIEDEALFE